MCLEYLGAVQFYDLPKESQVCKEYPELLLPKKDRYGKIWAEIRK
jgi:hypothetical protein